MNYFHIRIKQTSCSYALHKWSCTASSGFFFSAGAAEVVVVMASSSRVECAVESAELIRPTILVRSVYCLFMAVDRDRCLAPWCI